MLAWRRLGPHCAFRGRMTPRYKRMANRFWHVVEGELRSQPQPGCSPPLNAGSRSSSIHRGQGYRLRRTLPATGRECGRKQPHQPILVDVWPGSRQISTHTIRSPYIAPRVGCLRSYRSSLVRKKLPLSFRSDRPKTSIAASAPPAHPRTST
ncbi:hypothetical protein B0T16DRAFT_412771 [Cercophora newfieldiana]|uniref:Uncharacterized protein n=1 Tax=Cercophora newfieldiana TaxID=92897 RepID=A0AA39Y700_9PEZI|nr:hypothetical protein B0T16DRAFT_412771 [Cercophora newfieldiana]